MRRPRDACIRVLGASSCGYSIDSDASHASCLAPREGENFSFWC